MAAGARSSGWLGWVAGLGLLVAIGAGAAALGTDGLVQRTTDSGVKYQIIREGTGEHPGPTDLVFVNYEGRTGNGKVFDSSFDPGRPAQFRLDQVVPGFGEAVRLMKPGGQSRVVIPAKLAYGETGAPPAIGPNEDLTFDIILRASMTEQQVMEAQARALQQ